jgi:UDP-glucose 4-epimerase
MGDKVLVTGGTGYIGTHTAIALIEAGYTPIIVDNLCNSSRLALSRLERICGVLPEFIEGDVRDASLLATLFERHPFSAVIHFAGLKAVGESVSFPLRYYDNNVVGTTRLLQAMQATQVRRLIFSSSATVYGEPDSVPIREDAPLRVTNSYGRSKLVCEQMMRDLMVAEKDWQFGILRYFNPVGAHPSGLIGEAPNGIPDNLMPYVTQVAAGKRECLSVYGSDYPTVDGTGVRDYLHVVDLAAGHVAALDYLMKTPGSLTVNLGTGRGISVLELVTAFEQATGVTIPRTIVARRPGDVSACFADPSEIKRLTGWSAQLGVLEMCRDAWRWQSANPKGYA